MHRRYKKHTAGHPARTGPPWLVFMVFLVVVESFSSTPMPPAPTAQPFSAFVKYVKYLNHLSNRLQAQRMPHPCLPNPSPLSAHRPALPGPWQVCEVFESFKQSNASPMHAQPLFAPPDPSAPIAQPFPARISIKIPQQSSCDQNTSDRTIRFTFKYRFDRLDEKISDVLSLNLNLNLNLNFSCIQDSRTLNLN